MKRPASLFLALAALFAAVLSPAAGKDRLIAYPVPLNPATQTLKLKYEATVPSGSFAVDIFDVSGEKVFSRKYASLDEFSWKGFSSRGRRVGAGLYIVKVRREDADGSVSTDTVRILVKR